MTNKDFLQKFNLKHGAVIKIRIDASFKVMQRNPGLSNMRAIILGPYMIPDTEDEDFAYGIPLKKGMKLEDHRTALIDKKEQLDLSAMDNDEFDFEVHEVRHSLPQDLIDKYKNG